jgi:cyclin-dependent kinase 10
MEFHSLRKSFPKETLPKNCVFYGKTRKVDDFLKLGRIGEGTYGVVYKAMDTKTSQTVALKKIRLDTPKDRPDGLPLTHLRELNLLLEISKQKCPFIVNLFSVAAGSSPFSIFTVMEYCEWDMAVIVDSCTKTFSEHMTCQIMGMVCLGIKKLHDMGIIHRDLKLSNLLLNREGFVKIADFGLAKHLKWNPGEDPHAMTPNVVTLWYRAPELLLNLKSYTTSIDIWSIGAITSELLLKSPLLPGKTEIEQLKLTFTLLGFPTSESWKREIWHSPIYKSLAESNDLKGENRLQERFAKERGQMVSPVIFQFICDALCYDPRERATINELLSSKLFQQYSFKVGSPIGSLGVSSLGVPNPILKIDNYDKPVYKEEISIDSKKIANPVEHASVINSNVEPTESKPIKRTLSSYKERKDPKKLKPDD